MSAAEKIVALHARHDGGAELERTHPLIPEGEYLLRYHGHQTAVMFGRAQKVILLFDIVTPGEYFETRICAFYNAKKLIGPKGKSGRFKVGASSTLARDVARLVGNFSRMDRVPLNRLSNHVLVGRVATVTAGFDQKEIPECLRYSVVRELVRVEQ